MIYFRLQSKHQKLTLNEAYPNQQQLQNDVILLFFYSAKLFLNTILKWKFLLKTFLVSI